ncbi:MAG: hypothetical protein AAF560_10680 [Acidobacteriota bacterium]
MAVALAPVAAEPSAAEPSAAVPFVSSAVTPYVLEVDLRELSPSPPWQPGDPITVMDDPIYVDASVDRDPDWQDPVRQGAASARFSVPLGVHFPGIGFGGGTPPDAVGAVGPNHYIQMVNAPRFQIWDKAGNVIVPVTDLAALWGGAEGACAEAGTDPVVHYDPLAQRWIMTAVHRLETTFCFYISRGPDPVASGWFVYDFLVENFPDYPKYGVWPDAYYVSTLEVPTQFLGVYAFDRNSMLSGNPATFQRFLIPHLAGSSPRVTRILPASFDGPPPPADAPNLFVRTVHATQDDSEPVDRLEMWAFRVDFGTPSGSSFERVATLTPSPFTLLPCSPSTRDCAPQPGTTVHIDALFNRPLRRLQYRNFGSHQTMVVNQVVDAGDGIAGKRWYELRKRGEEPWEIHQQGTYAPDSVYRFMGSVAMNGAGHMALGYSVSDGVSVVPGIRMTARRHGEAFGTMTMQELTLHDGVGIQINSRRWGDYSSMNVDPVDDRTFWYTNQIVDIDGFWTTWVGSFTVDGLFFNGFESGTTDEWSNTVP